MQHTTIRGVEEMSWDFDREPKSRNYTHFGYVYRHHHWTRQEAFLMGNIEGLFDEI
jgi:hypothetical protein